MSPSRAGENTISDLIQNSIEEDIFEIIVLAKNARMHTSNKVIQVLAELEGHLARLRGGLGILVARLEGFLFGGQVCNLHHGLHGLLGGVDHHSLQGLCSLLGLGLHGLLGVAVISE